MGADYIVTQVAAWIGAIGALITIILAMLQHRLSAKKTTVEDLRMEMRKLHEENLALKADIARLAEAERRCQERVTQLERQYLELLVENKGLRDACE